MKKQHRAPWDCVYAKEEENACRPGRKPESDQGYFEILCLCILQAGLNWGVIRRNWRKYHKGFCGFNIARLSRAEASLLLEEPNVLRNKSKVEAIIQNAREFKSIKKEYGSFAGFLKSLGDMTEEGLIELLTKRFRHVGNYTAAYYLHAVGYRK
ncbi:MAG: DNA-3-methyladenine glycosylase I [Desulfobacteraceae bacterium]|jgi:DNA-3-methyladenine glycosylase I